MDVSGSEVVVRAADRVSAYSGESVSLSTQDVDLSAGGSVSAFAGECELGEWSRVCDCGGGVARVDWRDWVVGLPDGLSWHCGR